MWHPNACRSVCDGTMSAFPTCGRLGYYSVAELEVAKDGIFVGIVRQLLTDAFPDTAAEAMFVYRCELKDGTMLRAAQYRDGRCRRQDCFVEVATADELAGDQMNEDEPRPDGDEQQHPLPEARGVDTRDKLAQVLFHRAPPAGAA